MNTAHLAFAALPELALLRDHMLRCASSRSRLHRLQCVAEAIDAFLAPRFVTTLTLTLVIVAGAAMAL
ncbi:MAG: hypothetical protein ABI794_06590 [Betaproteobacteria bacterium]